MNDNLITNIKDKNNNYNIKNNYNNNIKNNNNNNSNNKYII